jgi:hypothetical protein
MGTFRVKRKLYTVGDLIPGYQNTGGTGAVTNYDRFNSMRNMSDADILAEKKRKNPVGAGEMATTTLAGGAIGAAFGGAKNAFSKDGKIGRGAKRWGIAGAIGAGVYSAGKHINAQKEVNEYNDRLDHAQRQAGRRERADWYRNQLGRANYTY